MQATIGLYTLYYTVKAPKKQEGWVFFFFCRKKTQKIPGQNILFTEYRVIIKIFVI